MKPRRPPAIAAWMLDHLVFTGRNEALAGDLQEELLRGRSNSWYRRQALSAIAIGFFRQARAQSPAVLFALLWSVPVPAFQFYLFEGMETTRLFATTVQLDWPWSALGAMTIELGPHLLLVWTGLLVYLWFHSRKTHKLSLMRLWHGLLATLPVFVGANLALTQLPFGHLTDARHATVLSLTLDPFFLLTRLPFFFSLLFSIWMALPRPQRNAAAV
jgi:hypothetical protein